MKKTRIKNSLSLIVCSVLIAAMASFTTGCNDNKNSSDSSTPASSAAQTEITELGQGESEFTFTVTDIDGKESTYQINTDKTIVGDALLELGLIDGDESEYGLYVKTVDGITLDYDKDGKYWAFYVDGEYAQTGVDSINITEGTVYSFKAE